MALEAMIDIETGATTPDAAIFAIGACVFERHEIGAIPSTFTCNATMQSNDLEGRKLNGDTMAFWFRQSDAAREALFEEPCTNLRQALKRLRMWMQEQKPRVTHIWANDPDFDIVILKHAFEQVGEMWPWGFWLNRSVRTITELAYEDPDDCKQMKEAYRGESTHHKAVDDAVAQAKWVQHCYRKLNGLE